MVGFLRLLSRSRLSSGASVYISFASAPPEVPLATFLCLVPRSPRMFHRLHQPHRHSFCFCHTLWLVRPLDKSCPIGCRIDTRVLILLLHAASSVTSQRLFLEFLGSSPISLLLSLRLLLLNQGPFPPPPLRGLFGTTGPSASLICRFLAHASSVSMPLPSVIAQFKGSPVSQSPFPFCVLSPLPRWTPKCLCCSLPW